MTHAAGEAAVRLGLQRWVGRGVGGRNGQMIEGFGRPAASPPGTSEPVGENVPLGVRAFVIWMRVVLAMWPMRPGRGSVMIGQQPDAEVRAGRSESRTCRRRS